MANKAKGRQALTAAILLPLAVISSVVVSCVGSASANESVYRSSDTSYLAIDVTEVTIPESRGVEPSPFILWRDNIDDRYLIRVMTLHHLSGLQFGNRLDVILASGPPAAILWSSEFSLFTGRGVEPSPFIVYEDFRLYAYPIIYDVDGTPSAGAVYVQQIDIGPAPDEHATCLAEMPGNLVFDEMPRLFIGTNYGNIAAIVYVGGTGFVMYDLLPISEDPVRDIELIPQYGNVILGALAGSTIYGYVYDPPIPGGAKAGRSWQQFALVDPMLASATDFDVFGITDQPLTVPDTTVRLVIADGTDQLGLVGISSQLSGYTPLAITHVPAFRPVRKVNAGSLLMLATDSTGVYYDPGYDSDTGTGGCEVNITDDVADQCGYTCGDANSDGQVNIADAVYLINYIFKGGPPPDPLCAGDANDDDAVNIGDAVYLITYIFKGGPPPAETCCP